MIFKVIIYLFTEHRIKTIIDDRVTDAKYLGLYGFVVVLVVGARVLFFNFYIVISELVPLILRIVSSMLDVGIMGRKVELNTA